jgi:leader peptidase (prepilin peptidase)/N-methyltransferase
MAGKPDAPSDPGFQPDQHRARSCRHCGHQIRWHENIPCSATCFWAGSARHAANPFLRYPAGGIVTGSFSPGVHGVGDCKPTALHGAGFSAALLALTLIDWDTTLLPDDITLPLLWGGLIASALQLDARAPGSDALWGASAGYLSLWLVYWAFKLATGKEGMGYGDFKLFAALGAWFGWQALVPIILMASVIGACGRHGMKFVKQPARRRLCSFRPLSRWRRADRHGLRPAIHPARCGAVGTMPGTFLVGLTGGIGSGKSTVRPCWPP